MKKLIILFLLVSLNAFGWEWVDPDGDIPYGDVGDGKLCGEEGSYFISSSFWSDTITNIGVYPTVSVTNNFAFKIEGETSIKNAIKNSINYWNEAGSEHHFYASDTYDDDTYISLVYCDTCTWAGLTTYDWNPSGSCSEDEEENIKIRVNSFGSGNYSTKFNEVMTHEAGHVLGIAHTKEPYIDNDDTDGNGTGVDSKYIMMNDIYYKTHITEDDKFGLRALYGKDDRPIKYAIGNTISGSNFYLNTTQTLGSGTAFETFAKPQVIAMSTNSYYDYMFVWVKSSDRKIYYSFAKQTSGSTSFSEVTTPIMINGSYEALTSPSVAVKDDGTGALVVFQQIKENDPIENQEYIYASYFDWQNGSGSFNAIKVTTTGIHTNSMPSVVWNEKTKTFIIFSVNRNIDDYMDNWKVKYLVSNHEWPIYSNDWNFSKVKNLLVGTGNVYTSWNEMSVSCNKKILIGSTTDECYLFFNKIYSNSLEQHLVNKYKFQTDVSNDNPFNLTVVATSDLDDTISNLGHISSFRDGSYIFVSVLNGTYEPKPKLYMLDNLSNNNFNTITPLTVTNNTTASTISLTGHAVAKTKHTNTKPYIITWIEE